MITPVVLDTNIVLDAWVFDDPRARALKLALASHSVKWMATMAMRDELVRVLGYPKILTRMAAHQIRPAFVLAQWDGQSTLVDTPPKASATCHDPDDQKFIDLAVAHGALLLSRDHAILCMKKKLLALSVKALEAL